jgi:hypothetical protein
MPSINLGRAGSPSIALTGLDLIDVHRLPSAAVGTAIPE